jgi:hypothetical protein
MVVVCTKGPFMPTDLPKRKAPRSQKGRGGFPVAPFVLVCLVIAVSFEILIRLDLVFASDDGSVHQDSTFDAAPGIPFSYSP